MSQSYTYSILNDFPGSPNGVCNESNLLAAITASSISTPLLYLGRSGDVLTIVFSGALSTGDKTTLDGNTLGPAGGLIASTSTSAITQLANQVTLDFGAFPGAPEATVVITGQTDILATSKVLAWVQPIATSNHSADEQANEDIIVGTNTIIPGIGFTIFAQTSGISFINPRAYQNQLYGQFNIAWSWE